MVSSRSVSRGALPYAVMASTLACGTAIMVESPENGIPGLYTGMIVWAFAWAFLDAFTIGANDVANAFANSVGAGTVTHFQACCLACVFELIGVVALGSAVTDTIRKKMVKVDWFEQDPYVLALGMSCVNLGSGLWVFAATMLTMPVSTTHAVVGAVLGVGIAAWGPGGVNWGWEGSGFASVAGSWVISPVGAGCVAALIYLSVKYLVLSFDPEVAQQRTLRFLPVYSFLTFGIIAGFMFVKGIPALKKLDIGVALGIAVAIGVFFGILAQLFVVPWTRRSILDNENIPFWYIFNINCIPVGSKGYTEEPKKANDPEGGQVQAMQMMGAPQQQQPVMYDMYGQPTQMMGSSAQPSAQPMMMPQPMMQQPMRMNYPVMGAGFGSSEVVAVSGAAMGAEAEAEEGKKSGMDSWMAKVAPGFYMDIGAHRAEDAAMHALSFEGDSKVERMFMILQLTSCCFFSLAHGANDMANAVGPLASVWMVYSTGTVATKAEVPIWILIYGGIALDIGIITMGHHIMSALGNRLTLQSPSRGFCIELGGMLTVMVASKLGIPVSTTHCLTGATTGVGLCNGNFNAVNWRLLGIIAFGWILTCPAAGIVTGLVFWGLASAPSPTPGNGFFEGEYHG